MPTDAIDFILHPDLDVERHARDFAARRRVHIKPFLADECAERLHAFLRENSDWMLVVNQGEKLFELNRDAQAAMTPERHAKLDTAVYAAARNGFQFRFNSIRVPDGAAARSADSTLLNRFAQFMTSEPVMALLRRVTGAADIAFADAQATAYGPSHFLTAHDDDVAGKNRRAAYVYNLTPQWRIDWGGLLMFHRADGHVAEGYTPGFNALNIFAVPQPHSVSFVNPIAPWRRISITGWLRAEPPPP